MSYTQAIINQDITFFGLGETLTDEQLNFIKASETQRILFLDSIAGGGKTTIAVALAKLLLDSYPNRYKKVLYTFSPVEEDKMGFRPGTQPEKEAAYIVPLKDALEAIQEKPERAIRHIDLEGNDYGTGWVTACSHTFMRGTNLPQQIIIIDEAQNFTLSELRKLITRAHYSSLIIVIGHRGQCDLPNPSTSGFIPYQLHYQNHPDGWVGKFTFNFRGEVSRHADRLGNFKILPDGRFSLTVRHDDGSEEERIYESNGELVTG